MPKAMIFTDKEEFVSKMPPSFVFVCFASFEKRSTTIPLSLDSDKVKKAFVLCGKNSDNEDAFSKICSHIVNHEKVALDLSSPIAIAKELTEIIKKISASGHEPLVIDITTFTHETLSMLLKLIHDNRSHFSSVFCLYNGASDYSNSKREGLNQMWLSKGCRDVRNIVGFPGRINPANKTCLMVLTGFELERATGLIDLIEPDRLVLGKGSDPTHPDNNEAMEHFHEKFQNWEGNYKHSNCSNFSFSCKNIEETINVLTEQIAKNPEDNYIIVPLNTKLSTISAAIVALRNPKIQLCYAVPEMYNIKKYSIPSENITVVDLFEIIN